MARTPKLTKERAKRIIKARRLGLTNESAAEVGGVCQTTLYNWLARGKAGKAKIYVEFLEAMQRADSAREAVNLQVIKNAARGGHEVKEQRIVKRKSPSGEEILEQTLTIRKAEPDWRAAAWNLQNGFKEKYGKSLVEVDWKEKAKSLGADAEGIASILSTLADEIAARAAGANAEGSGSASR